MLRPPRIQIIPHRSRRKSCYKHIANESRRRAIRFRMVDQASQRFRMRNSILIEVFLPKFKENACSTGGRKISVAVEVGSVETKGSEVRTFIRI